MSKPNPGDMLKLYRLESGAFTGEQAQLFRAMPIQDQAELLFYMNMHTNAGLRLLHDKTAPGEAPVQGMPDVPKVN